MSIPKMFVYLQRRQRNDNITHIKAMERKELTEVSPTLLKAIQVLHEVNELTTLIASVSTEYEGKDEDEAYSYAYSLTSRARTHAEQTINDLICDPSQLLFSTPDEL